MRRAIITATAATLALAGCAEVREALSPGRPAAPAARLALQVALAAPDGATLDLATSYVRVDDSRVPIGGTRVVLDTATTTAVPLGVDLAACLADEAARVISELPGAPPACRVAVTLRYSIAGTLRDVVTVGPLLVTPGAAAPVPASVTVLPRLVVRITNVTGVPLPPPGEVTVRRGESVTIRALVTDSTLARIAEREVRWSSSNAAGARVSPGGTVLGIADGTYTITAALPDSLGQATATVRVVPPSVPLTLALSGTGSGSVSVTPAGGAPCTLAAGAGSASCTVPLSTGAPVVLTAATGSFTTFGGFGGACVSAATTCTLTPTAAGTVTAGFALQSFAVTVAAGPDGGYTGTIRSSDGAIDCRIARGAATGTCSVVRPALTNVTLTAIPDTVGAFTGWGGDCAPSAFALTCTRTVGGAVTATAGFAPALTLVTTLGGSGLGRVDVVADGVARPACVATVGAAGTSCRYFVRNGAVTLLTATATPPSFFSTFDAPCEVRGTSTCRLTLVTSQTAFAIFAVP